MAPHFGMNVRRASRTSVGLDLLAVKRFGAFSSKVLVFNRDALVTDKLLGFLITDLSF